MYIRQLQYLLAIMDTGSLGKAAAKLRISQPALTKTIQRLEEELDVPLFVRRARGMQPTVYAEHLCVYARTACVGLKHILGELEGLKGGREGTVTIGCPPLVAEALMPEALLRLARERPNLRIRMLPQANELISNLLAGEYDIALTVLYKEIPEVGLTYRHIFDDRLVAATRTKHPLLKKKSVTARDLVSCDLVYADAATIHRRRLERYFEHEGLDLPPAAIECRLPSVIKSIVMSSNRVGLIALLDIEDEVAAKKLAYVPIDSPVMDRPIGFAWRDDGLLAPAAIALMNVIEEICLERGYIDAVRPLPATAIRP